MPARYRDFHSATAIGDIMYIFGGRSDVGGSYHTGQEVYDEKLIMFDTIKNSWLNPVHTSKNPKGRRSHSACEYILSQSFNVFLDMGTLRVK